MTVKNYQIDFTSPDWFGSLFPCDFSPLYRKNAIFSPLERLVLNLLIQDTPFKIYINKISEKNKSESILQFIKTGQQRIIELLNCAAFIIRKYS